MRNPDRFSPRLRIRPHLPGVIRLGQYRYPPGVRGRFRTVAVKKAWQELSNRRKVLACWWIAHYCPTTEVIGANEMGVWWNDRRGSTHLELWQDVRTVRTRLDTYLMVAVRKFPVCPHISDCLSGFITCIPRHAGDILSRHFLKGKGQMLVGENSRLCKRPAWEVMT